MQNKYLAKKIILKVQASKKHLGVHLMPYNPAISFRERPTFPHET